MKLKHKFVSPTVTRAVPLYPETDVLLADSLDSALRIISNPQEVEDYEDGETYTVDLY